MPKITVDQSSGVGHTRLWLDDVEVQDIRSISLQVEVADVVTAKVEVLATESLHFECVDARVLVTVVTLPGFKVVADTRDPDRIVWTVEKDDKVV